MQVKRSAITINLSEEEKNAINNFYDFLNDMTRQLYKADAKHTEFCTTLTNIMEEIMTLYDFWGDVLEEKLKDEKSEEAWDYIHEIMDKYLFYNRNGSLIPYPTITVGLSVRDWLNEFSHIYTHASSLRIVGELSRPAFDFFTAYTECPFLCESTGYYVHDTWTREWSKV